MLCMAPIFETVSEANFKLYNPINKELLFEYSYVPQYFLSIQKWYGYTDEANIIETYKLIAKYAFDNKQFILGSISDISETDGSFHLSNEWVTQKYIPKSVSLGYRYAFFVKPKDLVAELALEDALENLNKIQGLKEVKVFDTFEQAYAYAQQKLGTKK